MFTGGQSLFGQALLPLAAEGCLSLWEGLHDRPVVATQCLLIIKLKATAWVAQMGSDQLANLLATLDFTSRLKTPALAAWSVFVWWTFASVRAAQLDRVCGP